MVTITKITVRTRGTGKTARQMQAASTGATFVWCGPAPNYARKLAESLGRHDLIIKNAEWLIRDAALNIRSLKNAIVVDHALWDNYDHVTWLPEVRAAVERHNLRLGVLHDGII